MNTTALVHSAIAAPSTSLESVDAFAAQDMVASFDRIIREAAEELEGNWTMVRTGAEPATYTGGIPVHSRSVSSLQSRDEGRFWPFYEHEFQLQRMRALCRQMATFTSIAVGAMQALQVYVMGGEWEYEAIPKYGETPAEEFVAEVQTVLDAILEKNKFVGALDNEIHDASREDGCSPIAIYGEPDGLCDIRRLDADNLREPQDRRRLDAFLGTDWKTPAGKHGYSWSFGVLTGFDDRMGRIDHEKHLGYHICYDDTGSEWDFLPATPMAEGEAPPELLGKALHLLNRNVPRKAKVGVSDYFPVVTDMEREDKINTNVSVVTAILAAIPWWETMPPGTTREQAASQIDNAIDSFSRAIAQNRGGERSLNRLRPGTAKIISDGRTAMLGPLGQPKSDAYNGARQAIMRRIGVRWLFPEYMITGDASNENYASSLVAESPFVKARQGDQKYFSTQHYELLMKALKIAHDAGRFRRWVRDWASFLALIDLKITPPEVASRDKQQQIEELNSEFDRGIIDANEYRVAVRLEQKEELEGVTGGQNTKAQAEAADAAAKHAKELGGADGGAGKSQGHGRDGDRDRDGKVKEGYQRGERDVAAIDAALAEAVLEAETLDEARAVGRAVLENCGANAPGGGGFQPGNDCAKGDGGGQADLDRLLREKGGFTINPVTGEVPKTGFAVSPFPDAEFSKNAADFTAEDIYNYLVAHRSRIESGSLFVGGWHDVEAGVVYLDLTAVVESRSEAESLARQHGQEGYYDLKRGKTVIVKPAKKRRRGTSGSGPTQEHQRRRSEGLRQEDVQRADAAGPTRLGRLAAMFGGRS